MNVQSDNLSRKRKNLRSVSRHGASKPPGRAVARLRQLFFAQAGESAVRYRIPFDRVLTHLWHARRSARVLLLRSVVCMDDLVHVVACVDDIGLAWSDLADRYERPLVRRCRCHHDEIEATVLERRLLADLRRDQSCDFSAQSLGLYAGTRPLRNWLMDRLNAARARQRFMRPDAALLASHPTFWPQPQPHRAFDSA